MTGTFPAGGETDTYLDPRYSVKIVGPPYSGNLIVRWDEKGLGQPSSLL